MKIYDRYTDSYINESNLPDSIELGRFAIVMGSSFVELTPNTCKLKEGQKIGQELLDPINRDKHEIFELISSQIDIGKFDSIPLIQGIKRGLELGKFAEELEEKLFHIEAIFHVPYTKLNRSVEKVPVAKAKRISNRSNEYLAAHTEDWLHKSLVSFHPSRILTEEIIVDENTYENQLLIAFITRAAQHLERRLNHLRDISKFLADYNTLMAKYKGENGWYKKIRRELELAGKVYDEEEGNYKGGRSDLDIVSLTDRRLRKLRDTLLKLRQYDLFYAVDHRKVNSIQYHDTNVLINHKHYRYLKDLWHLLIKEEHSDDQNNKGQEYTSLLEHIRDYGISLINYVVTNVEYFGYTSIGNDRDWYATKEHKPKIALKIDEHGVIILSIGDKSFRFVVTCSIPKDVHIPDGTYIIAYDNAEETSKWGSNKNVIPVSLKDVESVERIAKVLREIMLRQYVEQTVLAEFHIHGRLLSFKKEIEEFINCISILNDKFSYRFVKYPSKVFLHKAERVQLIKIIQNCDSYIQKNKSEQKEIIKEVELFINDYERYSTDFASNLWCFNIDCSIKIEDWFCDNLNLIECMCGCVIDATDLNHVRFYQKNVPFSKDEMGMDYLEIKI